MLLCIAEKNLYFKVHLCFWLTSISFSPIMGANNLYSSRSMVLISDHQVCNPPPPPHGPMGHSTEHQIQYELTTSNQYLYSCHQLMEWTGAINHSCWGGGGGHRVHHEYSVRSEYLFTLKRIKGLIRLFRIEASHQIFNAKQI